MVFKHLVKHNGKYYPAGTDVPVGGKPVEDKKSDFTVDRKVVGKVKEDVIEITDEEVIKENQFTKTEINRMSTAELKEVAKLNGVEDADDMTGGELKKVLIDKFGL